MTRKFWVDFLERIVFTGLEAFGGVIIAKGEITSLSLKAAGVAAGLSAAKCLVASNIGNRNSASAAPSV